VSQRYADFYLKKRGRRGERTPPFFIKRKQHGFSQSRKNPRTLAHAREGQAGNTASPGRGKIPEPWPMPVRAKPYGEYSEGIFLPTGGNSSQLGFELATSWGRPYLSSSNQLD